MLISLVDVAWVVLQPLMFATSPELGGLGLSPQTIGLVLGAQGLLMGIFQVTVFGKAHARYGAIKVFRAALVCYAGLFVTFAAMVGTQGGWMWALIVVHILLSCVASLGFSTYPLSLASPKARTNYTLRLGCTFILITSSAPSPALLGTTNGLAQTSCSFIRALGPAGAASLFALSNGGRMVFCVCAGVVGAALGASLGLVE